MLDAPVTELAPDAVATTVASPAPAARAEPRGRIPAVDALRGAVMVLMTLDHARDFFFGLRVTPTDLVHTTAPLFVTRWVTHFCAPVFVFLAGASASLYGQKRGPSAMRAFLLERGVFLVLLELTVIRLCWMPDPFYRFTLIQVIWIIGWSMVLLAPLTLLPARVVVALGALIVLGHNTLDGVHAKALGEGRWLWTILHERGMLEPLPGHRAFVSYPLLPWVGIILLGYGFGGVLRLPQVERRAWTLRLGVGATLAFLALRALNVYGDPRPWSVQLTPLFTLLSFFNCEKYPPSLLYTLMTLGPALCLLSALDRDRAGTSSVGRVMRPFLEMLGGVPLFYYVAHLALLRYSAAPLAFAKFGPSAFQPPPGHAGSPELGLGVTYLVWLVCLVVLYPAAKWFKKKKEARPLSVLRFF